MGDISLLFVRHAPTFLQLGGCSGEKRSCCISIKGSHYMLFCFLGVGRRILGAVKER